MTSLKDQRSQSSKLLSAKAL